MKTCPVCQKTYSDEIESCPRDGSRLAPEFRDEHECPYCAERILKKARVCKHCGRDVEPLTGGDTSVQTPSPAPPQGILETQGPNPLPPVPEPMAVRSPETEIVPQFKLLSDGPSESVLHRQMDSGPRFRSISEPPGKMKHVVLGAVALLVVFVGGFTYGLWQLSQQATEPTQKEKSSQVVEPVPSTPKASRILTKDAEFVQLLHPPTNEDEVLTHSNGYLQRKREIEAKLAPISDPELRERLSTEEWAKVDKQKYVAEGEDAIQASTSAGLRAGLEKHRADWFEIGHVDYPGSTSLLVKSVEASPLELPEGADMAIDLTTMDGVCSKFRQAADQQITENVAKWMSNQTCEGKLRTICENLGGTPAECSDPAKLNEIPRHLGPVPCNDNPSAEEGRIIVEKQMRESRMVLMGQGDLIAHRIDKLLLVDYDTETVLLEQPPGGLNGKVVWKFPAETQRTMFDSTQYRRSADTDTLKDFGVVPVNGESRNRQDFNFGNSTENPLQIEISIQGNEGQDFAIQNGCSSGIVYPNGTCKVEAWFSPKTLGAHNTTVLVGGAGADWGMKEAVLKGFGSWPWDIYGRTPLTPPTRLTGSDNPQPSASEQSIRDAVAVWVNAFRSKDAIQLSDCYAPIVEKYFRATNVSHERVQQMNQSAFAKIAAARTYEVNDLRVSLSGTSSSDNAPNNRATATFRKTWDTLDKGGKSFSGEEIEQLTFAASPQGWKIIREEELKILRASRR